MLLEVVNQFKVELNVFVVVEGQTGDEFVEILDKVAKHGDLGLFLD